MMLKNQQGAVLVEAMIAVALFAVVASVVIGMMFVGASSSKQGADYVVAAGLLQEGVEATRSIRYRDFAELVNGTHGLTTTSGYFELSGTSETLLTDYTRTITIEDVYRDVSGDIAVSGTLDNDTKRITVNVTWDTLENKTQNIDTVFYVMNFNNVQTWVQTLTADYSSGDFNGTDTASASNGEVVLRNSDEDWATLDLKDELDLLDGNGDPYAAAYDAAQDIVYTVAESTTSDELTAIDVSDVSISAPTVLGSLDLGSADIRDIALSGGYGYLATTDNSAEVMVVDLESMTQVNSIDIAGTDDAYAVAVTGTSLLVGKDNDSGEEFFVYDISNPLGSLTQLGATEISDDVDAIATDGTYAYLGSDDNTEEIFVVRLSDYTEVNSVGLTGSGNVRRMEVVGTNLYVTRDNGSSDPDFLLLDISTPETSITVTSSLDTNSTVYDVDINEDESIAFLATSSSGGELTTVDLSTFTEDQNGDTTDGDNGQAVIQFGAHVFLLTERNGSEFNVFRTSEGGWNPMSLVGSDNRTGSQDGEEMFVDGNYAYMASDNNGSGDELFIYDISTPSSPTLLGQYDAGDDIRDVVVSGDYAYLATDHNSRELDVVDISTKSSPVRVGSYNASGNANMFAVDISGSTVYMGRDSSGADEFWSIDVSTPSSPSLLDSLNNGGDINDIVVDGTEVYAATDGDELVVFDVTTPGSLSQLTSVNLSGGTNAESIAITGDTLALGRASSGSIDELIIFDVSTPSSPSNEGSFNVASTVNDIAFDTSSFVFVGVDASNRELMRYDVSTPSSISEVSRYDADADVKGIYFDGTHAFCATEHNSLELQIFGESAAPTGYALEGTFTSQAYDSGGASTSWTQIDWTSSGTGSVEFRIRTASSEAGLADAIWVGSDGTEATSYSTSGASVTTDAGASGTQWVQWKAYLSGDGSSTPSVEDVTLSFTQ